MSNNQTATPTDHPPASKPRLLYLMLIMIGVQLVFGIALLVMLIVMGYIGFNLSDDKISISGSCDENYLNVKYSTTAFNHSFSISFVTTSFAILMSIVLLGLVARLVVRKPNQEEQQINPNSELPLPMRRYIGGKMARGLYILQCLALLCFTVVYAYYLSFYLQLPQCSNITYSSEQILPIMLIAALSFVFCFIGWIMISCMIRYLNQDERTSKKERIYIEKEIQLVQNKTEEALLNYGSKQEKVAEKSEGKIEDREIDSKDEAKGQFKASVVRQNPVFQTREKFYDSPYERIHNQPFYEAEKEPQKQMNNEGLIYSRQSRFHSKSPHSKILQKEQKNYLEKTSNQRILQNEVRESQLPKKKYVENSEVMKKNQRSGRKGILSNYLRGKYAD